MLDRVKQIIADELSVELDEITLSSDLNDDLGADSLDAVELIMAIEDEFDVEIPDDVATGMKTVQDIIDFLEK